MSAAKNICWMSLSSRPHVLGRGIGCLMCEAARREQAQRSEGAMAQGLQAPVGWTQYANLTREVQA